MQINGDGNVAQKAAALNCNFDARIWLYYMGEFEVESRNDPKLETLLCDIELIGCVM